MKTLGQVVGEVKRLRPSGYSGEEMTVWVNELQADIWRDVWLRTTEAPVLDWALDQQEALLLDANWSGLYHAWIGAQIDFHNGEYDKYQNSMEMYNAHWRRYAAWYGNTYLANPTLRENMARG